MLKENLKRAKETNIALFKNKDTFTSKGFNMTTRNIRNQDVKFCFHLNTVTSRHKLEV